MTQNLTASRLEQQNFDLCHVLPRHVDSTSREVGDGSNPTNILWKAAAFLTVISDGARMTGS
jgi:hypothetical protein